MINKDLVEQIITFTTDRLEEEFEKEMDIREEITFKKGYATGYEEAMNKKEEKPEPETSDEDLTEAYAEGYLEALDDAWAMVKDILEMPNSARLKYFKEVDPLLILEKNTPIEVMKTACLELLEEMQRELFPSADRADDKINNQFTGVTEEDLKEEEEEDTKSEFIGSILDSKILSDDGKRAILDLIDAFGDNIKITRLK